MATKNRNMKSLNHISKKVFFFTFSFSLIASLSFAQKQTGNDTLPNKTVVVTSAFKPSLKTTSKINFSAATPLPDSSKPLLRYDIPEQNLVFAYQSPALKPLAENIDSLVHWINKNYIKAGYGNFSTPYLAAGASFGDGTNAVVNMHGNYTSSKGQMPFQQFSKTFLEGIGIFNTLSGNEWQANLSFKTDNQYQYGYKPDTLLFNKDDLKQNFTTFGGKIGFRNKKENNFSINYNPSLGINIFSDNRNGRESTAILEAPVSKEITEIFDLKVNFKADVTSYRTDTVSIDNNLFSIAPALGFNTPNVQITAGFSPTWDNSAFVLLPNFKADIKINEEKFILQAGWVEYYNKNTYQGLANFNPWINQPSFLSNTKVREQYAGFKGSAGHHVTYNARVSYLLMDNQPLFVNDTSTGESFNVINESGLKDIRIHGELGYTVQEKFSFIAGATFNQYSGLINNAKAYGLLPVELNAALRWQVMKGLLVKSDLFFWDGNQYLTKDMQSSKTTAAADVNAGVEFSILPQLNIWLQFNNLFNNKYERWNQYPVLGTNVLAGVVYSFDQKK